MIQATTIKGAGAARPHPILKLKGSRAAHAVRMTALFLAAFGTPAASQAAIPIHGFKGDMASKSDTFVALDINGDGKTDFLFYRPGSGYAGVYISNGDGSLRYVEYSRPGTQSNGFADDVMDPACTAMALDINGDGKIDFLWYRPGSGRAGVYLSNGDGTVRYVDYSGQSNGFFGDVMSTADRALALDINGDGKSDFLWYRPGSGYAGVYISNGDGTLRYVAYKSPNAPASNGFQGDVMNTADTAVALDINGDGRSDFLWYRPGYGYAGVYISRGDGTLQYVSYKNAGAPSTNGFQNDAMNASDRAVALDINGDGKTDFLWYSPGAGYAGVYISRGDGTLQYVAYKAPGAAATNGFQGDVANTADTAVPLDINGDGKTDFLWYRPGFGYAGVYVANPDGSGSVTYTQYSNPNGQSNGFPFDALVAQDTAIALNLQGKKSSDFLWMRPGGGYAGACLSTGGGIQCLSYEGSEATWMADLADQIANVPLKGIAMPGTHDSAMYKNLSDVDLAKTQEDDFTGQLNAGARWFDFRTGYYTIDIANLVWEEDGAFMTCADSNKPSQPGYYFYGHSNICSNIGVGDALDQIKAFLDTHPKEIVVLDIRAYIGASRTSDYAGLFETHLAPYIYKSYCTQPGAGCDPDLAPQNYPPSYFWSNNQRAILLLSAGDSGNNDDMWPKDKVASGKGYDGNNGIEGDPSFQLSFMQQDMDPLRPAWSSYGGQTMMLQLAGALTPSGALGGVGCLSYCFDGPIGLAQWFNPALVSQIQGAWQSRPLNAFTVDYISCCGIADAIINFNDQQWIPVVSSARDIGAGKNGSVWKIDGNGTGPDYGISSFMGSGWYTVQNKQAVRVAVDPNGLPWVVDSRGMIWRLKASTLSSVQSGTGGDIWESIPGVAQDIGIGADGSVWVIGSTGALFQFNGSTWTQLPGAGAGVRIAVDNFGKPVVIGTDSHGIFRYDGTQWSRYADGDFTTALDIGAGADGSIWVAGTDSQSVGGVWRWNGTGWDRFRGGGTNVAVDGSGSPWVVTSTGSLTMGKIR